MKICVLLTYANPHVTGWIDELIKMPEHEVYVGIMNSVKKYRTTFFGEADDKSGYLYFFKGAENSKTFYDEVEKCECFITLGIFEKLFVRALIKKAPGKIFVISEPFNPFRKRRLTSRRVYVALIKLFTRSKFYFLCTGGIQVKKDYCSIGFKKSMFLEYGHFPPMQLYRKPSFMPGATIRFIFVGQLIYRKGIDILIDTIKYLQNKYDNWEFLIIGDGNLKNKLLDNCVDEKITYIENIEDPVIMKTHFNGNHILFLPSYFDGWGAVVNEALSSCCSLLLSDKVYSGKSLLRDGLNGFSFDPYQLNELYKALDKYFSNPAILNLHFHASEKIFKEWNHNNAAISFHNFLLEKGNNHNELLLKQIDA